MYIILLRIKNGKKWQMAKLGKSAIEFQKRYCSNNICLPSLPHQRGSARAREGKVPEVVKLKSPCCRLTPINYQISYDAYKEFVDAQGVTQVILTSDWSTQSQY